MPIDNLRQRTSRTSSSSQADDTRAPLPAQGNSSPQRDEDRLVAGAPSRAAPASPPSPRSAAPLPPSPRMAVARPPADSLEEWEQAANIPPRERQERSEVASELRRRAGNGKNPLYVAGDLDLRSYTSLVSLPADLRVGGSLSLSGCTSLVSLPTDLRVGGNLYLNDHTSLVSLPAGLRVGGDLYLIGCTSLVSLPADLRVGGELYLIGCTSLVSLPTDLRVGENLYLDGCTSLVSLPADLRVGGNLYLRGGCTSLTTLPPDILQWPRRTNGQPHGIFLEGSGLSTATRQRLRDWAETQGDSSGVVFHLSEAPAVGLGDFASLQEAIAFWHPPASAEDRQDSGADTTTNEASALRNSACAALCNEDQQTLRRFLGGLRNTMEYRSRTSRPHLRARVSDLLESLQDNRPAGTVLLLLHNAMATCGDRLIRGLDEVEQYLLVENAAHGSNSEDLRRLGASFMRLEVVHEHAARKVRSLVCVDEVEVYLVYETRLADRLGLPFATRQMLYGAEVTGEDLALAETAAMAATADTSRLNNWLHSWSPWQKHLRRQEADGVRRRGYDGLAEISDEAHAAAVCPYTLSPFIQMRQPVTLADAGAPVVAELDSLLQGWVEDERHPVSRRPFTLAQLRRATIPSE